MRSALDLRDRFAGGSRSAGLGGYDLRVGAHLGEIVTSADGDVYGDGINAASRLQGSASPGEVWVSEDVWRLLRQRPEFGFEPRGEHALKGLASPMELYSVRLNAGVSPGQTDARPTKRSHCSTGSWRSATRWCRGSPPNHCSTRCDRTLVSPRSFGRSSWPDDSARWKRRSWAAPALAIS
ncbi:MAG: adenylate/guanylate cyclase domain-containing protein [Gemmatimonadota bacterium]